MITMNIQTQSISLSFSGVSRVLRVALLLVVCTLTAFPLHAQQRAKRDTRPDEVRSGRSGIMYGGLGATGRGGSQYGKKSKYNNDLFERSQTHEGAWTIGVTVGPNLNWQTRDSGYAYDMAYNTGWGAAAGLSVTYEALDWLFARIDVQFMQKNYSMHRMQDVFADKNVHTSYMNNYLQVPLLADWTFGSNVRSHILTGAYTGGWLNGQFDRILAYSHNEQKGAYTFTPEDNRFDAGLAGGVGVTYDVLPNLRVGGEVMLYYSLTSTLKKQPYMNYTRYNNTLSVSVTASYKL